MKLEMKGYITRIIKQLFFWRKKCNFCGYRTNVHFAGMGVDACCPSCWIKRKHIFLSERHIVVDRRRKENT